jgi:hypothetical protein
VYRPKGETKSAPVTRATDDQQNELTPNQESTNNRRNRFNRNGEEKKDGE